MNRKINHAFDALLKGDLYDLKWGDNTFDIQNILERLNVLHINDLEIVPAAAQFGPRATTGMFDLVILSKILVFYNEIF